MRWVLYFFSILLSFLLLSCASLSTFQTPEVLPEKKVRAGVGFSGINGSAPAIMELSTRMGLGKRMDAGLKFTLPGTWFADLKYGLLTGPTYLALDLGVSYFQSVDGDNSNDIKAVGFYPMILFGKKHVYGGVKWVILNNSGTFNFFGSHEFELTTQFPGIMVGLNIGSRFRLLPEANVYFLSNETLVHWGIGFQYDF